MSDAHPACLPVPLFLPPPPPLSLSFPPRFLLSSCPLSSAVRFALPSDDQTSLRAAHGRSCVGDLARTRSPCVLERHSAQPVICTARQGSPGRLAKCTWTSLCPPTPAPPRESLLLRFLREDSARGRIDLGAGTQEVTREFSVGTSPWRGQEASGRVPVRSSGRTRSCIQESCVAGRGAGGGTCWFIRRVSLSKVRWPSQEATQRPLPAPLKGTPWGGMGSGREGEVPKQVPLCWAVTGGRLCGPGHRLRLLHRCPSLPCIPSR